MTGSGQWCKGTKEGLVSGVPKQPLALNFTDRNFWQLKERKDEERGDILVHPISGLQDIVITEEGSGSSPEHVQNDRDKLVLEIAFTNGLVPGSFTNETMPCRQRGQATEPGGP
ncbi:hypothetical protein GH714_006666 [Hevea brasiliensis]|uniref:Uncharacterized protein n=1 Tax=Hevea brasiliensis TaxID=3981 RepID=A0A6A6MSZ3_HEVBR|nr:hypothetical protein GH714_006666 [Hevea brasiliensis]